VYTHTRTHARAHTHRLLFFQFFSLFGAHTDAYMHRIQVTGVAELDISSSGNTHGTRM